MHSLPKPYSVECHRADLVRTFISTGALNGFCSLGVLLGTELVSCLRLTEL